MDYQKAIKEAEIQIDMYESMILYNKDFEPKNDNSNYERKLDFLKTAISAMQELQEYKKLGTLEEMKLLKATHLTGAELAKISCRLKQLEKYVDIGTLEEVREAVEKHKWIPCSERLPEESGKYEVTALDEVHVTVEFSNGERRVDTGKTIDGKWKCQARIIDPKAKIVAWMPNPEPYM